MAKTYDNLNDRMSTIRPELQLFVRAMETKLSRYDKERGESWKTCKEAFLIDRLNQELREYFDKGKNRKELVDVANFCFFLWLRNFEKELGKCSFFSNAGPSR